MKKLKNTGSAPLCLKHYRKLLQDLWGSQFRIFTSSLEPQTASAHHWLFCQAQFNPRAGHFRYFLIFSKKKNFFAFIIKLIWLGEGFLNRTGAEIGY